MKRLLKLSLFPLILCIALAAQATASVEHIHVVPGAELDCPLCLSISDLVPAGNGSLERFQSGVVAESVLTPLVVESAPRAPQSRGPPSQI